MEEKILIWSFQSECNLDCRYCYYNINPKAKRIPLKEKNISEIDKITNKLNNLGFTRVYLSGGEPLIYPDLTLGIVEKLSELGIRSVLSTNGTLVTKDLAKDLISSGLDAVVISLDSFDKDYHNSVRESFQKVVKSIKIFSEVSRLGDFRLGVKCVVTRKNVDDLKETMEFSDSLGADFFKFQPVFIPQDSPLFKELSLTKNDYNKILGSIDSLYEEDSIVLPGKERMKLIFERLKNKNTLVKSCFAGKSFFFLNEKNILFPCTNNYILGNYEGKNILDVKRSDLPSFEIGRCERFSEDCACLWTVVPLGK